MSGYWRINKQKEQYKTGKGLIQRINHYIKLWESRCYSDGIPDEVPNKLMGSGRVPSYKAIAISILKNDFRLTSLGFQDDESHLVKYLRESKKREIEDNITGQLKLF